MESFWMRVVDSRNRVSLGGILWKTTLAIEDFPLLLPVSLFCRRKGYDLEIATDEAPSKGDEA